MLPNLSGVSDDCRRPLARISSMTTLTLLDSKTASSCCFEGRARSPWEPGVRERKASVVGPRVGRSRAGVRAAVETYLGRSGRRQSCQRSLRGGWSLKGRGVVHVSLPSRECDDDDSWGAHLSTAAERGQRARLRGETNEEVGLTSCDPLLGSLEVLNDDDEPGRREGKR